MSASIIRAAALGAIAAVFVAGCGDAEAAKPSAEGKATSPSTAQGPLIQTAQSSAPAPSGPLPIRHGLWGDCSDPIAALLYDGRRIGFIGGAHDFWEPVGPVDRSGQEYFLEDHSILIEPLNENEIRLTIQDDTILIYCPEEARSAAVQAMISQLTGQ